MVIDAIQLLLERNIGHPSRIVSAEMVDGQFRLTLAGYPWWRGRPDPDDDGSIRFHFSGVTGGELFLADLLDHCDDEALETFDIRPVLALPWAEANGFAIYCSAPLPRPLAIYMAVQDYLFAVNAAREPGDFLNGGHRLSDFLRITASAGYLLANCPTVIRDLIVDELGRQSVTPTVHGRPVGDDNRLFVRLGRSTFFCTVAEAEFDR
jgi:hypothetical protein